MKGIGESATIRLIAAIRGAWDPRGFAHEGHAHPWWLIA